MTLLNKLKEVFMKQYGSLDETHNFFSPGRVNLIGEYTDFNGGYVFPCALSIGNYGIIRLRHDQTIQFYSENFAGFGKVSLSLSDLSYQSKHGWANYAKGVIHELIERNYQIPYGFDIAIYSDLPSGAGLSSSASVEVLIATMMVEMFHLEISKPEIALLCQKVENQYIGVNCGIMDQFVIANGTKDHALLLDTGTLDFQNVPLELNDYEIVICNSNVKRGLVDSKYNERRSECEEALQIMKEIYPIKNLCDMMPSQIEGYESKFNNPIVYKRMRHAVTENDRTKQAVAFLKNNDIVSFGKLITLSHLSLKDDFEVSIDKLDGLVEIALQEGSIGSRMTGAGFGGCTVNIVEKDKIDQFRQNVIKRYHDTYGLTPDVYIASPSDGTKEMK